MSDNPDFYALLGVSRTATDEQLKKAYRKLARELHPDVNPEDPESEKRFKQITFAYEVLRDPERRQRYDQSGIEGVRGSTAGAQDPFGFGDMNLGDIFDAFFGGSGNTGGGFGGSRRSRTGPPPGADIETTAVIDLEQAVFGAEIEATVRIPTVCEVCTGTGAAFGTEPVTCRDCQGQGELRRVRQSILGQMVTSSPCTRCQGTGREIKTPCETCRGEGRVTSQRTYPVSIPAGIDRGQTLRLTGRGGAGARGGSPGDLYVHVDVRPHDRFVRENFDLLYEMHVSVTQAALGAELPLTTLDGIEDVHLDPGTQTGKKYKFRGKGVQHINGRGRGDLVVHLVVDTPTQLDAEQVDLLRRLAELRGESVAEPESESGILGKIKGAFR